MRSTLKCDIIVPKSSWGFMMKKKIVYISGADTFDVNDVRAAFEEVRSTLNLDSDTILFGVPVDDAAPAVDRVAEPATCETATAEEVVDKEPMPEPEIEPAEVPDDGNKAIADDSKPAVPILSVLASKSVAVVDDADSQISDSGPDIIEESENIELSDSETDNTSDEIIDDMLNTDAPEDTSEKTLETLLESMTPLREDEHTSQNGFEKDKSDAVIMDDVDATLENLASEFAETQDKMPKPKKNSERGKIGKLKNILPFKKMKKDDSGLMGDLFGWAGIAANDEDFSIPGFFTNAASKK